MIITSAPSASTAYRIDLPEIGRDYFVTNQKVLENEFIATSSSPAGFFRQLVKYDVTSIKRTYRLLFDLARASVFEAMLASNQTSFYVNTLGGIYNCIITGSIVPAGKLRALVTIDISVIARIS